MIALKRDDDGWLIWQGDRHYKEPNEAIKTWWAGELRPGCNARVYGHWSSAPCGKTPKHDPDAQGRPTKCGIHCAAAVERRKAKQSARDKERRDKFKARQERAKVSGELTEIVMRIAAGHNDPRSLCADWVDRAKRVGLIAAHPPAPATDESKP